ncbi:hypothetical protein MTO96_011706 [Rhipicephalus appendiculatus]
MNSNELKNNPDWDLLNVDKFKHTATNKGKSMSERRTSRTSVYGTKTKWKEDTGKMPDVHDIYALAKHGDGRGGHDIRLSSRSTVYANRYNVRYKKLEARSLDFFEDPPWLGLGALNKIYENMKLFNSSSKRLLLFAQVVSLGTQQSEYGWKLLTLGFDMFRNKTHITEKEMKDVIGRLPGPTYEIAFQVVINSMIVYDLLIFNGTSDYDSWMSMEFHRLIILAVPVVSRKIQSQLCTAGLLKTIDDWYVMQLSELIMLRLIMVSMNASYGQDVDALLSNSLDVGVTPEFLKAQKDFMNKNRVSAKVLEDAYRNVSDATWLWSLYYANNSNGSCFEPAQNLPHLSPKNANNTEALAKEVDAIIDKMKETDSTKIGERCIKEMFFLKLLTMTYYDKSDVLWRDISVMKWANMSDTESATTETFSNTTNLILRVYSQMTASSMIENAQKQTKSFVWQDNVTKQAEAAVHEKLVKAVKNGTSQMSNKYSSDTVVSSPMSEDSEENDSGTGQPSGPGAHPVLIVAETGDSDESNQYTSATTPAVQQTEMSAQGDIGRNNDDREGLNSRHNRRQPTGHS